MKRTPIDNHFILITLLLVFLLGMRTAYSLTEEDEVLEAAATPIEAAAERAPASLAPTKIVLKSTVNAFVDFDLSCEKKLSSSIQTTRQFVQLKGKNCLKNFQQDKIEIVNKSNGYTASVFPFGKDQYQTDLIQLVEGENEITIRYATPSGAKYEKTVMVHSSPI